MNPTCRRVIAGTAVLLGAACGDSQGPDEPRAGSITINAPSQVMQIDATMQLSATVLNTTGGTMANPVVSWGSSDASVAEVSLQGLVTARTGGVAWIRAMSGSVSDSVQITVQPPACTVATTGGTIAIGGSAEGTLDPSTCLLPHGAFGNGWRIVVGTPTTLAITMTSTTLDALVVVTNLNFDIIGYNDDSGASSDSRLLLPFQPGEYVIWATTFPGEQGDYQLAVNPAQTGSCTEPRGTIGIGQTVSGTLTEAGSCLLNSGHFADIWQFTTATEVTVTADLTSTAHDSYLLLADSENLVIAADDDGGEGLNSRIIHTLAPGTYTLWASTYEPGVLGSYQLGLTAPSAAGAASNAAAPGAKAGGPWERLERKD